MPTGWLLYALAVSAGTPTPTADEILAAAPERIRRHRMAELTVTVTDADGRPVPGADVRIEQVRHAFLFGCNIFGWDAGPPEPREAYRERFAELFNYATLPFYWAGYERQPGDTQEDRLRATAEWCRARGITPKGHPLVWSHPASSPGWLPRDAAEVRRLSDARVTQIVAAFRGLIDVWDVVNEPTDPTRFENAMGRLFAEIGTVPLTVESFRLARAASPAATLLINDYRLDPAFAEVIAATVDAAGQPVYDVIGLQTHQHGGVMPLPRLQAVCDGFARFGVPLHFTEATIVSGPRSDAGWATTPEGEAAQAEAVERFYTVLFAHPAVEAITWWDLSDRGAWQNAPAGLLRADMSPKPAYEALHRLVRGDWWTDETARTGADGTARLRVFLGAHRVASGPSEAEVTVGEAGAEVTLRPH